MNAPAPKTYRLGLIGYPLGHSLSPCLHQAALKAEGLSGDYSLYAIPVDSHSTAQLAALLQRLRRERFTALTSPSPTSRPSFPCWTSYPPPPAPSGR